LTDSLQFEQRARELRLAFDSAFAKPAKLAEPDFEELLLISIAGDRYALRLHEVSAIRESPTIVEVPSDAPGLLGIAGVHGNVVPVFRLAHLLGYTPSGETLPWLVVCGSDDAVAFAFDGFESFVRAPRSALRSSEAEPGRKFLTEFFSTPNGPRPVVALTEVIATIRRRSEKGREREET
jgi:chemotaxis signal transduction protein